MKTKKKSKKKSTATKKATTRKATTRKVTAKSTASKESTAKKADSKTPLKKKSAAKSKAATKPKLLSGDNPQIPKGYGDEPVRAYINAIPGWKHDLGRRLDELVTKVVPRVRKAVKWNSPFYGAESMSGWFLSFHCFTKYIKVTFFRGTSLKPIPPGSSKHPEVRYLDIYEDKPFDEAQFVAWVKQAMRLPGEEL